MNDLQNIDFKKYNMGTLGYNDQQTKAATHFVTSQIKSENVLLLQRCHNYWDALHDFRERRKRSRMYHRGLQWKDMVYDTQTKEWLTEEDYIKRQGKMPLKQNQIRQLIKNLIGQFLSDISKPAVISRIRDQQEVGEMLTNTMQYVLDINRRRIIDRDGMTEFLISGAVFQKVRYKYWPKYNREDVFFENRFVTQMFFNDNIKDPRLTDMDLIGEFYDVPLQKIIASFAKTKEHEETIKQIYSSVIPRNIGNIGISPMLSATRTDSLDFYVTVGSDLCRVYEIWQQLVEKRLRCHDWLKAKKYTATLDQKNTIDQINANRIAMALQQGVINELQAQQEILLASQGLQTKIVPLITYEERNEEFWYVKYLTPNGYCLYESETVYQHKEHPYSILLYPLIDGEVWGFVEDIIDQQRYINRLIMLMDFMIGASAKGVLLVPEDAIPDDMDIDDIADEWHKFNGVIKLKLKAGVQIPKQISSKATIPGVNELLSLQLKFINDISGVSQSIQGQRAPSGTPAKLYAQETYNASLNTKDYFESFADFQRERNWKVLKTIIQFYDEERKIALAGSNYTEEAMVYNPEKAQNAEVDVVMTQSAESPVYRAVIEDSLQQFVSAGLISLEMYLKNSTLPFSDKLLTDIQNNKQQMIEQGNVMNPQILQELGNQMKAQGGDASKADPNATKMIANYMGI